MAGFAALPVSIPSAAIFWSSGPGQWLPARAWAAGKHPTAKNTPTGEGMKDGFRDRLRSAGSGIFPGLEYAARLFCLGRPDASFPLGARFVNRLGENFMDKYSPYLAGPNTDPHFTTIGMALEIRDGRGPIIFDVSPSGKRTWSCSSRRQAGKS